MSFLNVPEYQKLFIAVLVMKLGGKATITQKDIDQVAYNTLKETDNPEIDGLDLELITRKASN